MVLEINEIHYLQKLSHFLVYMYHNYNVKLSQILYLS